MAHKLVISLVLYQTTFSKIVSYDVLMKWVTTNPDARLFIYDNSEAVQSDSLFDRDNVQYIHDGSNPGLATAYNQARDYFEAVNGVLLLLVDQDTQLTETYIEQLTLVELTEESGAFVPLIYSQHQQISPVSAETYVNGRAKKLCPGDYASNVMAINSGTALPQKIVAAIGEFNTDFPLDFLDHWLFWKLRQLGKHVHVFNEIVEHDLSVLDYKKVSTERYRSILRAETRFYKTYQNAHFSVYKRQLLYRAGKQLLKVRNKRICLMTLAEYLSLIRRTDR